MELHSILPTLSLNDIDKSLIEIKKDGAVFDVPLSTILAANSKPYGSWQDNQSQQAGSINVGYPMIYRVTDVENGINVLNDGNSFPTQITFTKTGIYNLQFSAQFENSDSFSQTIIIWLRKNGVDVPGTGSKLDIPSRHGNSNGYILPAWNYYIQANAGDYYQLIWSTSSLLVQMEYYPAGNPPPATASIILTVHQL